MQSDDQHFSDGSPVPDDSEAPPQNDEDDLQEPL